MALNNILLCHESTKTDFIKACGNTFHDTSGVSYTDFESGCWSTILGHSHPRINKVICDQIENLIHLNHRYTNMTGDKTAGKLIEKLNIQDGRCTFLSSGSEAVTFCLKAIRMLTGRTRFLTLKNSYLAAYGEASEMEDNNWVLFDAAVCKGCTQEKCSQTCSHFNNIDFDQVAGFVFEPGSASGSVRFPNEKLIQAIGKAIKKAGGLILVNEVTTGMGKTGKWFGFQHYDITPDMVAVGKGLGNGYPVSAAVLNKKTWEPLLGTDFRFAQSHTNDPLGCAVALEVITVMEEERMVDQCQAIGTYFLQQLKKLQDNFSCIRSVRGRGLMLAIELESEVPFNAESIFNAVLAEKFLVGFQPLFNVVRFYPALTISRDDIDRLVVALNHIFNKMS